jgi:hypothetical protein
LAPWEREVLWEGAESYRGTEEEEEESGSLGREDEDEDEVRKEKAWWKKLGCRGAGEEEKLKETEKEKLGRRSARCAGFPLFARWGRRRTGGDVDEDVIEEVDGREGEGEEVQREMQGERERETERGSERERRTEREMPRRVVGGRARLSKLVYGVTSAEYEVSWGDSSARGDGDGDGDGGEGSVVRRRVL